MFDLEMLPTQFQPMPRVTDFVMPPGDRYKRFQEPELDIGQLDRWARDMANIVAGLQTDMSRMQGMLTYILERHPQAVREYITHCEAIKALED